MKFILYTTAAICAGVSLANADTVIPDSVIADLTSAVTIDPAGTGVTDWKVTRGGRTVDVMYEEGFWFRTGSDTQEHRLGTVPVSVQLTDTNAATDPLEDVLNATYTDPVRGFSAVVKYSIQGSPFGCCSDLAEQVTITNLGSSALAFTLFEYTDFDIVDIPDSVAYLSGGNTFVQQGNGWKTETIVAPSPDRWEIDTFSSTRDKLLDGDIDNLSNSTSPLVGGDLTWAAQWDFTIPVDASVTISKDKLVSAVPLPASIVLMMPALGGLAWLGRRRARVAA